MLSLDKISLIAVDADDTLWVTQPYFDEVQEWFCTFLSKYGPVEHIDSEFYRKECENIHNLGYGTKAFLISLVESAIEVSSGRVSAGELKEIIGRGRRLFDIPAKPLSGVEESLRILRGRIDSLNSSSSKTRMIIFTKGDMKEQKDKIDRSGLLSLFDSYRVYSEKHIEDYKRLFEEFDCEPSSFVMIGNSFKSDIDPVVKIGGKAIYVPFYAPWKYEATSEYDHNAIFRVDSFSAIPELFV